MSCPDMKFPSLRSIHNAVYRRELRVARRLNRERYIRKLLVILRVRRG